MPWYRERGIVEGREVYQLWRGARIARRWAVFFDASKVGRDGGVVGLQLGQPAGVEFRAEPVKKGFANGHSPPMPACEHLTQSAWIELKPPRYPLPRCSR